MMKERAIKEILSLATEDYHGLWEIRWLLATLFPSLDQVELIELGAASLRELIRRGWVTLNRGTLVQNRVDRLQDGDALAMLESFESWADPESDDGNLLVVATNEGRSEYLRSARAV